MNTIVYAMVHQLAAAIRRRDVSAVDLVAQSLQTNNPSRVTITGRPKAASLRAFPNIGHG